MIPIVFLGNIGLRGCNSEVHGSNGYISYMAIMAVVSSFICNRKKISLFCIPLIIQQKNIKSLKPNHIYLQVVSEKN